MKANKEIKVKITFTDDVLGMMPADPEVYKRFIATHAPDAPTMEDEIREHGEEAVAEKTLTVFHKLPDGTPYLYDYQLRGFFKDAMGMLRKVSSYESSKIKAFKKAVDGLLFIKERQIPFQLNGEMGTCERPLRAETMQGPRIALAYSETVPAGSVIEFTVQLLDPTLEKVVRECLDYGVFRGIGQWRNSGKGRFTWQEVK